MKDLKKFFTDMTLAHEELNANKMKVEVKLLKFQQYIINVHEEGFN